MFKGLTVIAVALLMLGPLGMLRGLVGERTQSRAQASESVARDAYVLPEDLSMDVIVTVASRLRKLGVYEFPVYTAKVAMKARLEPARGFPVTALAAPLAPGLLGDPAARDTEVTLEFAGTNSLVFLPLARSMRVTATGNWPHPGFTSGFLPVEHRIQGGGFDARWQVLDLNRSYGGRWKEGDVEEEALRQSAYYLLLLALAEHAGFGPAYSLATVALCALVGVYLAGALRSVRRGVAAGAILASVYSLLYFLVTSQDGALLMGALALFALLSTLMILTRNVDWYRNELPEE